MSKDTCKILLVGDKNIGKTSLLNRYTNQYYPLNTVPTIGVDMVFKHFFINDLSYKLQLWDMSGNDRYRNIITTYFNKCDVIIFAYDITNSESFENIVNWIDDIRDHNDNFSNVIKILIGTKSDLKTDKKVDYSVAKKFAEKYEFISAIECSAKNNNTIDKIFVIIMNTFLHKDLNNELLDEDTDCDKNENYNIDKFNCKCCAIS